MSLLTRGSDTIRVFDEVTVESSDGNIVTRPGTVGVIYKAVIQPINTTEAQSLGGENVTTTRYRMRLIGHDQNILGSRAQIEWRGVRWAIEGEAQIYNGSPQTAHVDYIITRS